MRLFGVVIAAFAVVPRALAEPAHAEPVHARETRDAALARSLYTEGVAAAGRGAWDEAADRFRRAYTLRPTPHVAYNLATALSHGSTLVEAHELFQRAAQDPAADQALRDEAEQAAAEVATRMPRLTVHVPAPRADTRILLDGELYPRVAFDVLAPIDPGPHAVQRSDGDRSGELVRITLSEREQRTLTLSATPGEAEPAWAQKAPAASPATDHEAHPPRRWLWWTAAGIAAVGAGVTIWAITRGADSEAPVRGSANPGSIVW